MTSLNRAVQRTQAKKAYAKFAAAWRKEKAYQAYQLANGEKLENPRLGKKPTFQQWLKIVNNPRAFDAKPADVKEFQDEQIDTSWDEEEKADGQET